MKSLATIPGVRIAAVCDVWDVRLEQARKLADPKAFSTKIFEEVLERSDIDAVLIGSPDHWHVAMTIAACEAGKDVYVEATLYVDLGRYEIHPERGREIPYSEWVLGAGRRGADFYERHLPDRNGPGR